MTTRQAQCELWADTPVLAATQSTNAPLNPVTGDLFHRMQAIFEQRAITRWYKVDFYEHDRDIVENDMQVGDCWIWMLRECGTDLQLLNGSPEAEINQVAQYYVRSGESKAFFLIRISADKADIEEITREQAMAVVNQGIARGHARVPRRQHLQAVIQDFLNEQAQRLRLDGGLLPQEQQRVKETFGQLFNKGDESYIVVYNSYRPASKRIQVIHFKQQSQPTIRAESPAENQNLLLRNCAIYRLRIASNYGHAMLEQATAQQLRARLKRAMKAVV